MKGKSAAYRCDPPVHYSADPAGFTRKAIRRRWPYVYGPVRARPVREIGATTESRQHSTDAKYAAKRMGHLRFSGDLRWLEISSPATGEHRYPVPLDKYHPFFPSERRQPMCMLGSFSEPAPELALLFLLSSCGGGDVDTGGTRVVETVGSNNCQRGHSRRG